MEAVVWNLEWLKAALGCATDVCVLRMTQRTIHGLYNNRINGRLIMKLITILLLYTVLMVTSKRRRRGFVVYRIVLFITSLDKSSVETNLAFVSLPSRTHKPLNKRKKHKNPILFAHNHYFSFFLGRSWLEWPHLRLRQLVARGGRRACRKLVLVRPQNERSAYITLATDHLVAVVFRGKDLERGFDNTTTETEDEVQSRFLLDVVVGQSTAILELFTGKDQTLLIRRNSFLVLCCPTNPYQLHAF